MRFVCLILLVSIFAPVMPVFTQTTTPTAAPPVQPAAPLKPLEFGLPDGTPVKLRTARNLSSADETTGGSVDFEVLEDVKVGDTIVIPRGSTAIGTVTNAKPKGRMGKAGKLDITLDYVRTPAGDKVALRAVKETKGGSNTGAMTGAIVATSILFFPAAPFFLFMKGKDINIPKGTAITAYVNGDTPLDRNRFVMTGGPIADPATGVAATSSIPLKSDFGSAGLLIKSTPDGADIFIDDKAAGTTPFLLTVVAGEHTVVIKKDGFKTFSRFIRVERGSNTTLEAPLEKFQ